MGLQIHKVYSNYCKTAPFSRFLRKKPVKVIRIATQLRYVRDEFSLCVRKTDIISRC